MKFTLFLVAIVSLWSCNDDTLSQEEEYESLQKMFAEIKKTAESESCQNAEDWLFTPVGTKSCGGAAGYLAYNSSIDKADFLEKVAAYKIATEDFNTKWGINSDCNITPFPVAITCENGKPVFVY